MRQYLLIIILWRFAQFMHNLPSDWKPMHQDSPILCLITNAGDERLFVVQRQGKIRIIDGSGTVLATPFLDIQPDRIRL